MKERNESITRSLEWIGAALGLLGALLLALNNNYSWLGWYAFLASNGILICFCLRARTYGLLLMQLGFTATSLLGIVNL